MIVVSHNKLLLMLIGFILASGGPCQAAFLTTTFGSNNLLAAPAGNFFDITVAGSGLKVTSLEVNVSGTEGQTFGVTVYDKVGTYLGSEQNSSAWTVVSTGTGVCAGTTDAPELVTLNSPIVLKAQTTYGWFVTITTPNAGLLLEYTFGTGNNQIYSNSDLTLTTGASESSYFGQLFSPSSKVFQDRVWNGTIEYNTVPEPASFAMVALGLAAILVGRTWQRRKCLMPRSTV
jgi:PEP-CTERM motif